MRYLPRLFARNTILGLTSAAVFACASPALLLAQTRASSDVARILSLENAWNDAEMNHDVRSLELLIADTFVYTDDDGSFLNRSEWLNEIRKQVDQYEQLANTGVAVVLYENAAVVTGEYKEKVKIKGKMVLRSGRFTDTWIRRNGEWKCVASQATLIDR
jgi:Domain of unknown function (DUF4440)